MLIVKSGVRDKVRDEVWDKVRVAVEGKFQDEVHFEAWARVREVMNSVTFSIWLAVESEVVNKSKEA